MTHHDEALSRAESALLAMAIENWRLSRLFARALDKLDVADAGRYVSQLRYFQKKVDSLLAETGFRLVSIEGVPFDSGAAVIAVNLEDFAPDDMLLVDQMIEPIIMGPDGLKKEGTALLRKMHQ